MATAEFETAFNTFYQGCAEISRKHAIRPQDDEFEFTKGRRYWKVIRASVNGSSRSVHVFVDTKTGGVLKAASWSAPAKGSRGNIFDENNGLGRMGPYGAGYNR